MTRSPQEQAFHEIHEEALRLLEFVNETNSELHRGLDKIIALARYEGLWSEQPEEIGTADE
jgi:hypothetical protein